MSKTIIKSQENKHVNVPKINPFSYIPMNVLNLLWFTDGPLKNCERIEKHKGEICTIDEKSYEFAISLKDPICLPKQWDYDNEKSFNYASYYDLTSVQRGAYILWLQDIDRGSYTYFLKLFLNNVAQCILELPNKLDDAFDMMIHIYEKYERPWLRDYCARLLIISCMTHGNDMLKKAVDATRGTCIPELISALAILKEPFSIEDIMNLGREYSIKGIDRKYINKKPDLFKDKLKETLIEEFGYEYYPLQIHEPYNMDFPFWYFIGKNKHRVFFPDFARNDVFKENIKVIINLTNLKCKKVRRGKYEKSD